MADVRLRTNRNVTVEVLSPLHIGSGSGPLLSDYDFVSERGTVWVIDQVKLLEDYSDEELRHGVPEVRLSRRLAPGRYEDRAAYTLAAPGTVGNEILPCLKDVQGRPYLPGSSLKGALRSVVGWAASRSPGGQPNPGELGRVPKYAAGNWERRVFGDTPNKDLLRGLLVDDTASVSLERIDLALVTIYSLRGSDLVSKGQGYSFSVEAIRPGTALTCRLGLGEYVLSHPALELRSKRGWLDGLAAHCRQRAAELIEGEKSFYAAHGPRPLHEFYEGLERQAAGLAETQFLLQMSWGTGWNAKTLGASLRESPSFGELRGRYGLGRTDAPFPKSRRLVERGGAPSEPLGWVKVTL